MPLIDLKTDLKSLKFGKDRPGGGSSNQPYIQKAIPEGDPSNIFNTGGPDFLLRGGVMAPIRAANDTSRLAQMLFDLKSPNGLLFTATENLLSRTAVKTEATEGAGYGGGTVNAGIYTPLSTLGQAAAGFSGTHLNLLGLDPTSPMAGVVDGGLFPGAGLNRYGDVVKNKDKEDNRLVTLLSNEDSVNILQYSGGPGSVLGIGDTSIKFADQRTGRNNPLAKSDKNFFYGKGGINKRSVRFLGGEQEGGIRIEYEFGLTDKYNDLIKDLKLENKKFLPTLRYEYGTEGFNVYEPIIEGNTWPENTSLQRANGSLTYDQEQLINANPVSKNGKQQDFRRDLIGSPDSQKVLGSTIMSLAPSYDPGDNKTIEGRVNLGDPGKKNPIGRGVLKYSTSTDILDKINASTIYTGSVPNHSGDNNDLVKFSIGIQNNSSTTSNFMNFRAFIDSFSDQYSADWGNVQYIGRADKFYNYKGFDRTISMGWTVYAQSKAELIPMYRKLNYLASSLAPTYSTKGYMQGNLARITVGGYLYNQLGFIKGLTYDVPTESPWEIGIDENGDSDSTVKELPFMIKVTGFQFVPIQDFIPQKSKFIDGKQTSKFISLSNGNNNNY